MEKLRVDWDDLDEVHVNQAFYKGQYFTGWA